MSEDGGFSGQLSPPSGRPHLHPNAGFSPAPEMGPDPFYGTPKQHPLATAALVCGISSVPTSCCCSMLSLPLSIAAVVCAIVALSNIKSQPERHTGKEMAIAGLIMGVLGMAAFVGMMALGMAPQLLQKLGYI